MVADCFWKSGLTAPNIGAWRIRQELGFDEEPIERQLGHAVKGPLGAAYNRADFVAERRRMMQAWADYLERLQVGVTPLTTQ